MHLAPERIKFVISEGAVGPQKVGLDALGGLHRHLGAVLQDEDGELVTGHTGQPQTEVTMHLKGKTENVTGHTGQPQIEVTMHLKVETEKHLLPCCTKFLLSILSFLFFPPATSHCRC